MQRRSVRRSLTSRKITGAASTIDVGPERLPNWLPFLRNDPPAKRQRDCIHKEKQSHPCPTNLVLPSSAMQNDQVRFEHRSANSSQSTEKITIFARDQIFAIATNCNEGIPPHHLKFAAGCITAMPHIVLQPTHKIHQVPHCPVSHCLLFR